MGYRRGEDDEWHMLMPFENVHGNGGLLTTVADLLKFTHNLDTGEVGGPAFIRLMHEQGTLDSGRQISYAGGLFVGEYKGVREVQHSGGHGRLPGLSHALPRPRLGRVRDVQRGPGEPRRPRPLGAELYLADAVSEEVPEDPAGADVDPAAVAALAGGYRDTRTGQFMRLTADGASLRLGGGLGGMQLAALSDTEFASAAGVSITFEGTADGGVRPAATMNTPVADGCASKPVGASNRRPADLAAYVGTYRSDEAEVTYRVEVEDGALVLKDRYGDGESLAPVYPDAFTQGGSTFIFHRDGMGQRHAGESEPGPGLESPVRARGVSRAARLRPASDLHEDLPIRVAGTRGLRARTPCPREERRRRFAPRVARPQARS